MVNLEVWFVESRRSRPNHASQENRKFRDCDVCCDARCDVFPRHQTEANATRYGRQSRVKREPRHRALQGRVSHSHTTQQHNLYCVEWECGVCVSEFKCMFFFVFMTGGSGFPSERFSSGLKDPLRVPRDPRSPRFNSSPVPVPASYFHRSRVPRYLAKSKL